MASRTRRRRDRHDRTVCYRCQAAREASFRVVFEGVRLPHMAAIRILQQFHLGESVVPDVKERK